VFLFHFAFTSEKKEMMTLRLSFLLVFIGVSYGLNNGLGRTPQMGKLKNKIFYSNTSSKGNNTMT
jgi:hypothetical protein